MNWRTEYIKIKSWVRDIECYVEEVQEFYELLDDNGDPYWDLHIYSILKKEGMVIDKVNLKREEAIKYFRRKYRNKLKEMLEIKENLISFLEKEKQQFISNINEIITEMKENNFDVESAILKYKKYLEYEEELEKYQEVLTEMRRVYDESIKSYNSRDEIELRLLNEFKKKYNIHPAVVLQAKKDKAIFLLRATADEVMMVKEREFTAEEAKEFEEYINDKKRNLEILESVKQAVELEEDVYLISMNKAIRLKYEAEEMQHFECELKRKIMIEVLDEEEFKEIFKNFLRRHHTHYLEIQEFELKNNVLYVKVSENVKGKFIGVGGKNIKRFTEILREKLKKSDLKVILR